MKRTLSIAFAGLIAASCANQPNVFYIEKFYPLGAGCSSEGKDGVIAGNGYLDVAAGNPVYVVGMRVVGGEGLTQTPIEVGGQTLESENRNRPLVTQQIVNYRLSKRVGSTPKPYITNLTVPFVEGEVFGAIQIISPELGQALVDGLTPANDLSDFVDISVDVEFRGEYTATKHPFTTGVLTFPIRAYKSAPTASCTNGFARFPVDAATGQADTCAYIGQSYSQTAQPPIPSTCCSAAGAPEC